MGTGQCFYDPQSLENIVHWERYSHFSEHLPETQKPLTAGAAWEHLYKLTHLPKFPEGLLLEALSDQWEPEGRHSPRTVIHVNKE